MSAPSMPVGSRFLARLQALRGTGTRGMRAFRATVPLRAQLQFYAAVFCSFATVGFMGDVMRLGQGSTFRLVFGVAYTGAMAAAYAYTILNLGAVAMVAVAAVSLAIPPSIEWWFGSVPAMSLAGPSAIEHRGDPLPRIFDALARAAAGHGRQFDDQTLLLARAGAAGAAGQEATR